MNEPFIMPGTPDPVVSVIVPIYGAEAFLDQALDSVESQTLADIEIICLNDGSPDGSLEIMRKHAESDPRIKVIDKENQGYGATCNRGISEARGSWIAILEPDDWIEPEMYATMVKAALSHGDTADIVKTPYWRIVNPDTPRQQKLNCSYRGRIKPKSQPFDITEASHLLAHHPSVWSAIYRKDFLDRCGIRFREFKGAGWADNPFLIETLCQAKEIIYVDEPFYCYREETDEKARNFHLANRLLPLERWIEMNAILKRLGITDEGVVRAHNSRGFTYLSGILESVGPDDEGVNRLAGEMFSQMDERLVMSDPHISPGCKALYRKLAGLVPMKVSSLPYCASLIEEGAYNLKNIGLKNTADRVLGFLHDRKSREGSTSR